MNLQIKKIVTGGQTGVDRAGLDSALENDLPIGGWCPKGRRAEDGPLAAPYPLRETPKENYSQRTEWNVRDSDGTLILVNQDDHAKTGGTALTVQFAQEHHKPYLVINMANGADFDRLSEWVEGNEIQTLNIAGPRESKSPGIYNQAKAFLNQWLKKIS